MQVESRDGLEFTQTTLRGSDAAALTRDPLVILVNERSASGTLCMYIDPLLYI